MKVKVEATKEEKEQGGIVYRAPVMANKPTRAERKLNALFKMSQQRTACKESLSLTALAEKNRAK